MGEIVINSTGTDHLHGGEMAMLEGRGGRLVLSGITAGVAMADSWGRKFGSVTCSARHHPATRSIRIAMTEFFCGLMGGKLTTAPRHGSRSEVTKTATQAVRSEKRGLSTQVGRHAARRAAAR